MPQMAASAPLKPLLFTLHDSVMLLAARGWRSVTLHVVPHGRLLRLERTETKGVGASAPLSMPRLGVDVDGEAFRLSEGLSELSALLRARGQPWKPGCVEISRQGGQAEWRFTQADGSLAWLTRLQPEELSGLLITDQLFDAVSGTERAFDALQAQLEPTLTDFTGFDFDARGAVLKLARQGGACAAIGAQLVGTYADEDSSWTWGWGSPLHAPGGSERVRRVCSPDAPAEGLSAFRRARFQCDEGLAWALAGHVAVAIGARGLFRATVPANEATVAFALMEQPE